ncbi:hypothetical protein [Dactylosporangium sp. NPDC051484]|uniref:hypothetical protein n=1 Tax=Dactylosporangium sp. NPDC051484 TaxID=3154942 RepID=UPI00344D77A8
MPDAVTGWLDSLADLEGVPFNYLVPDAAQAAGESLRFFSVAEGWMAALLDGALSLGRVTPADLRMDATLAADLAPHAGAWASYLLHPGAPQRRSGFLLRSHAVAGWPDLRITAPDGSLPVRTVLLSADTVLVQFASEITGIRITQPPQALHFTLGDDAAAWQGGNRVVDVAALARARIGAGPAAALASATFAASMLAGATTIAVARG